MLATTKLLALLQLMTIACFTRAFSVSSSGTRCCHCRSEFHCLFGKHKRPLCARKMNINDQAEHAVTPEPPIKHHTVTVCMCPPIEASDAWNELTRARTELRDPGLFRWPPHANLLYPFISVRPSKGKTGDQQQNHDDYDESNSVIASGVIDKLRNATLHCDPFVVTLDTFGTFGGNQRGVLWLYPRTSRCNNEQQRENEHVTEEPLIALQRLLEQEFPFCTDQRKQGGVFNPHMTLSHFESVQDAKAAQRQVESWWQSQSFTCNEIYLLERKGDDGQFLRVATLGLGPNHGVEIHDPPQAFPAMPKVEVEWVREEREKLKRRRNGSRKRRGGRRRRKKSPSGDGRGPSRSTDTPEEIAAKRAARKAKRERLERERMERGETDEIAG